MHEIRTHESSVESSMMYQRAMSYLASSLPIVMAAADRLPVLYDANNRPMPPARYQYAKQAAKNTGSLRNWRPRRLQSDQVQRQRQSINDRISDLVGSDYHAAGVVNKFPVTVVGDGLTPYPSIDEEVLDITPDQARAIETAQRRIYARWSQGADVAGRRFGEVQFTWERGLIQFGESLSLVLMKPRPGRRYRLCVRLVHPGRLKTPIDKRKEDIFDGVEVNKAGMPIAAWIKKIDNVRSLGDKAKNFYRIEIKKGHRFQVLHDFYRDDPEQFRGTSPLAPLVKGFKDLNDFLDAELVSNVVTAAFSLFIELQQGVNPIDVANNQSAFYDTAWTGTKTEKTRYQVLDPGLVMYGNPGEKPHAISGNRPGTTFEPFVRELKKAFAHALNVPYPVLFHDVDGVSHAGFRSAMLEAWRVFTYRRQHIGRGPSQTLYNMLMEEAFLMGDLDIPGGASFFYENMDALCACEWYGAPKGDIEPYKAIKSDLLAYEGNIKTKERIILEHGSGTPAAVTRQIEKEKKDEADRGISAAGSQTGNDSELNSQAEAVAAAVADELEARNGVL
ncbi:MAG: phage portal protein [Thermodesulfobacteriota bacterium]|nr:phage portal protein [Thermodesulfobacteriota bacterium]